VTTVAFLGHRDRQDHLERTVVPELQANPDNLVSQAVQLQFACPLCHQSANRAHLVPPDHLDHKASPDLQAALDSPDLQAKTASLDRPVRKDHLVHQVNLVQMDPQETLVLLLNRPQQPLENLDHRDPPAHKDHLAQMALPDKTVNQEDPDRKAHLVPTDSQETPDPMANLDQRDRLDHQESLVFARNTALWMAECFSRMAYDDKHILLRHGISYHNNFNHKITQTTFLLFLF